MPATRTVPHARADARAGPFEWGLRLGWIATVAMGAAGALLFAMGVEFAPGLVPAIIGAFALALVLITLSFAAVLFEQWELAELEVRLERAGEEHDETLRRSEETLAAMGLPADSASQE